MSSIIKYSNLCYENHDPIVVTCDTAKEIYNDLNDVDVVIAGIGTGGTIASKATKNGLAPAMSAEDLLEAIPSVASICKVECIQAFSLDSTNVRPGHWLLISGIIKENYNDYDGFVVTHGTDTLAYTAAGLSYIIQNSKKPIVLTGAQKPMSEDITDAKQNLIVDN